METPIITPKTPDEFKKLLKNRQYWVSDNPNVGYLFFKTNTAVGSELQLELRISNELEKNYKLKWSGVSTCDIQKENDVFYLMLDKTILPDEDNKKTKKVEIKIPKQGFLELLPLDGSPHIYILLQDYKPGL